MEDDPCGNGMASDKHTTTGIITHVLLISFNVEKLVVLVFSLSYDGVLSSLGY